ncbi:hypothetical protein Pmar_PMAR015625, partial [Perkinsus marinus ATCC 50983]
MPEKDEDVRYPWSSQALIDDLKTDEREEWNRQIQEYQDRGWWHKEDRKPTREERLLAATVFPVRQCEAKTTKIRPCVDLRKPNERAPTLRSAGIRAVGPASVPEAVARLRAALKPRSRRDLLVKQYDLAKAFYSIRVLPCDVDGEERRVWIRHGDHEWFSSDALVFGLSCGPLGLNYSQLVVLRILERLEAKQRGDKVTWICVMDDFLAIGERESILKEEKMIETLWGLTGFTCPSTKRSTWSTTAPTRWLGCHWCYDGKETLKMVRPRPDAILPETLTKRAVYRAAGQFLHITRGFQEALATGHADAMRRLAGKWDTWDEAHALSQGSREIRDHHALALRSWERCSEEDSALTLFAEVEHVIVEVDASQTGHGYYARDADSEPERRSTIIAEARAFTVNHAAWHVNRKELTAIAHAVRRIDDCLDNLPKLKRVTVRSDSRVVTLQCNPWVNIGTKSIERKALQRLREAVTDIAFDWKTRGITMKVEHIAGKTNRLADQLSRIPTTTKPEDIATVMTILNDEITDETDPTNCVTPSFRNFIAKWEAFTSWRRVNDNDYSDDLYTRWVTYEQQRDTETRQACEALKVNPLAGEDSS